MSLPNNNPTKTVSWQKLTAHFNAIKDIRIQDLYKDENRKADFSLELNDLFVDFSKK